MAETVAKAWQCDVCGYVWLKIFGRKPTNCPNRKCRSRKWNSVTGVLLEYQSDERHATTCKCLMCKPPKA